MISKLLFSLSLAVSPLVAVSGQTYQTVSAYDYTDFDTFQTADKYLQDFDYLPDGSYRISDTKTFDGVDFTVNYSGYPYRFYAFPIYYEFDFSVSNWTMLKYYENGIYQFYVARNAIAEVNFNAAILNYIGTETKIPFLALDYIGMLRVIERDTDTISIYNSFYNFFTGFFPENVVTEYHGIFTFVIVAFLLFLVFGFVFFLFRVIRRLVGFK